MFTKIDELIIKMCYNSSTVQISVRVTLNNFKNSYN